MAGNACRWTAYRADVLEMMFKKVACSIKKTQMLKFEGLLNHKMNP